MTVDINIDVDFFSKIKNDVLEDVFPHIESDILAKEVIPVYSGDTRQSLIDSSKIKDSKIILSNTTDYAADIYEHGYNNTGKFNTSGHGRGLPNREAAIHWFDKYLYRMDGAEEIEAFVAESIARHLK